MLGGGGSNILRGGKRSFECKTLVGNFVEESYRPGAMRNVRDGGAKYTSTTRNQMQEGARIQVQEFGAGLHNIYDTSDYNYSELIGADKTRSSKTWQSISQSVHNNADKPSEFAPPREMKGRTMRDEELKKHRDRWTNESEALVKIRYITENSASMDPIVKPQFRKELCNPIQPSFK
ncbi:uncharacterized protein PHALS_02697 [Plasmopara halstedii]|uniref:Uncharacterized protein n=1 Tax=Plasmopara halstedii TaxID=4781 RepID=A0A0P1AVC9_PLAHL|nr:uncharacterized protein PHALS_02697 [Plasmopara halstedii]CEG46287.1 hypothetical protein PHALS_02697 [Plasmopara halstedii]|eukprot:XP_024582656.1 hypothetical protein PHALS_02697 [Plasmopara halstedii]